MEVFSSDRAQEFLDANGHRETQIALQTDKGARSWDNHELRVFLERVRDEKVVVADATLLVFGAASDGSDVKISGASALRSLIDAL